MPRPKKLHTLAAQCLDALVATLDDNPSEKEWTAVVDSLVAVMRHRDCPPEWREAVTFRLMARCADLAVDDTYQWPTFILLSK